jgi:hypothetical protein
MRTQIGLIVGSLALVQAAAFGQHGNVAKRSFLDGLLDTFGQGQNRNSEDSKGGKNGNDASTVTETVRQTITVGGAGAGTFLNATASTVTVTAQAPGGALGAAAADRYVLALRFSLRELP